MTIRVRVDIGAYNYKFNYVKSIRCHATGLMLFKVLIYSSVCNLIFMTIVAKCILFYLAKIRLVIYIILAGTRLPLKWRQDSRD